MPDVSKGLTYVENPDPNSEPKPIFYIYGVHSSSPGGAMHHPSISGLCDRFWGKEEDAAIYADEQNKLGAAAHVVKIGVY